MKNTAELKHELDCARYIAKEKAIYEPIERDYEVEIIVLPNDIPVRGNAIVSGDDDFDAQVENEIIARLESGDVWAWAAVEVKVSKWGHTESEFLGSCSYADEEDFKTGGYYTDMLETCVERILAAIESDQPGEH